MEKSSSSRKLVLLLILITLLYFLPGVISPRGFWVEDETRYAQVLKEMMEDGDLLILRLNEYYYPDKPPLYFWLSAISAKIFGNISLFSFMLVTWLTTLGTAIAAFALGRKIYGERAAFIGALAMMSALLFISGAAIVRMDMLLTMFVTLALFSFWSFYRSDKKVGVLLFWLFSALAVLTKGPLGLAFTLLPAAVFLMLKSEWRKLFSLIINPGLLLFIILTAGWLAAAWLSGNQDYVNAIVFDQVITRAADDAFHHKEPIYFYLLLAPVMLLPWTPYLYSAVRNAMQSRDLDGTKFLLLWFILGFIVISLISGKLFLYLLPLTPPLGLLLGNYFERLFREREFGRKAFTIESLIVVSIFFGLFIAAPFIAKKNMDIAGLGLEVLSALAGLLLILGLILTLKKYRRAVFATLLIGMWVITVHLFLWAAPRLDYMLSSADLGAEISALRESGFQVATCKTTRGIFNFYSGGKMPELAPREVREFLESSPRNLALMKRGEFNRMRERGEIPPNTEIVLSCEIVNLKYVLVKYPG